MSPEDYPTYGAYLRAKNIRVAYCRSATNPKNDATAQKRLDADLAAYRDARRQGVQPETLKRNDVEYAMSSSERHGVAYDAGSSAPSMAQIQEVADA